MRIKRIAAGLYEAHTNHGVYGINNCPADNPRATGLPSGPRWMLTYPGETTADAEFPTKRAAVAHIGVLHDEHARKADVERQNRTRLAAPPARLTLDEALEYADQMRRDTTCVGLPNWPTSCCPDATGSPNAEDAKCDDCTGKGCHWCYWTGKQSAR